MMGLSIPAPTRCSRGVETNGRGRFRGLVAVRVEGMSNATRNRRRVAAGMEKPDPGRIGPANQSWRT
jgi:hypothetical protein